MIMKTVFGIICTKDSKFLYIMCETHKNIEKI